MDNERVKAELEPCPFCGTDHHLFVELDSEGYYIECTYCMAEGPREATPEEAKTAWNRRH